MSFNEIMFLAYLAIMVVMSLVAIIAYIDDKNKAKKGKMRTKEKTLLFMAVFFGAVGSLIGRIIAHHKTDKTYFTITIMFSLILQVVSLLYLGALAFIL